MEFYMEKREVQSVLANAIDSVLNKEVPPIHLIMKTLKHSSK